MTVRVGLLMPHYSARSHSYWPLVAQALADTGAVVDVVHPPRGALDLATLRVSHDLYVLRKLSGFALSLAGALHELDAAILNPYPASTAVRDKIVISGPSSRWGSNSRGSPRRPPMSRAIRGSYCPISTKVR